MARRHQVLLGILVMLVTVSSAPSEESKTEDIVSVDKAENLEPKLEENVENLQGVRQKRFYNYFDIGPPLINPAGFYPSRDFTPEVGPYADPLVQIHKRLQEISDYVKQPAAAPSLPFAFFYPVFFVPQSNNCFCFPATGATSTPSPPISKANGTLPDVANRLPELEDVRQNWGFVVNENDADDDNDLNDRPISFDPIRAGRPMARPPPPVDHGSRQGDSGSILTTTRVPPPPPVAAVASIASFGSRPQPPPPQAPSICEKAVLSCCHQNRVTYECFVNQGCPNLSSISNRNPCDPSVIVRVIDRFQNYYGQRNGV